MMKRMSLKRIVLMLAMIFSMASGVVFAQSSDEVYQMGKNKGNEQLVNALKARQKALKKEQQALQDRIDSAYWEESVAAINDTTFTLEADKVVFKYGQIAYVNSNTNFVSVNKNDAVVQVAFNVPFSGPNGIGGVTVQGNVSGYKVSTDKKGTTTVTMNVMGVGISAQIWITMYKGTHEASVDILPNFNSRRITLNGVLLPLEKSNVYQGRTL